MCPAEATVLCVPIFLFFADASVFERGWPEVPTDWRCPEAVELVTPALQLRDLLHRMVPASNLLAYDATLWLGEADDDCRRAVMVSVGCCRCILLL